MAKARCQYTQHYVRSGTVRQCGKSATCPDGRYCEAHQYECQQCRRYLTSRF